jgi:hypothetical protein
MSKRFKFESKLGELASVDAENGRIYGVSLISEGPALGHGVRADSATLATGLEALQESGSSLPAYITHDGAVFGDRITTEIGIYENYRIEDNRLRADFRAFDSFKKDDERLYNRLFEIAEKIPNRFGLSIVFLGERVWATDDEGDIPAMNEEPPENAIFREPSIRIVEVDSADFVGSPAANANGLFEKIDNNPLNKMTKEQLQETVTSLESEKTGFESRIEILTTELAEANAKVEQFDALSTELEELKTNFATVETERDEFNLKLEASETAKAEFETKLSAAEIKIETLKELIAGERFEISPGGQSDDYQPSRDAKDKRIAEFAREKGITEDQAVIQLSRLEPELWASPKK